MIEERTFSNRYLFRGRIELTTALHIGGGRGALSPTDSPVVKTPGGHPFVPGSGFKGAFRSTVEKLAPAIPCVRSCQWIEDAPDCVGAPGKLQKQFHEKRRQENWDEQRLLRELDGKLCDTCLLFGSPFIASRIQFRDLYLSDALESIVQIRDGVALDRDSEKAVDRLKFDYEVVPASLGFELTILLEEPTPVDLGLAAVGLTEYVAGFGHLGGKRSRGLGACVLQDLRIYELNLRALEGPARAAALARYLKGRTHEEKMSQVPDPTRFLERAIEALFTLEQAPAKGGQRAC